MSELSKEIHDAIKRFPILDLGPIATTTALLDILGKMSQRIDELEIRVANVEKRSQPLVQTLADLMDK